MAYSALGEIDTALDYLEEAYEAHSFYVAVMNSHWLGPYLDPLRDEPRFQAILEKMNFPEPADRN